MIYYLLPSNKETNDLALRAIVLYPYSTGIVGGKMVSNNKSFISSLDHTFLGNFYNFMVFALYFVIYGTSIFGG